MPSPDFTRTSFQVERDILNLVDSIDRSLDSSHGESERKGHFVFSALVSALAVFGSILGIQHLVAPPNSEQFVAPTVSPEEAGVMLNGRDLTLIGQHLQRARNQVRIIRETKARIAPSMLIDRNLDSIDNSMVDLAGLTGADEVREPLAGDGGGGGN